MADVLCFLCAQLLYQLDIFVRQLLQLQHRKPPPSATVSECTKGHAGFQCTDSHYQQCGCEWPCTDLSRLLVRVALHGLADLEQRTIPSKMLLAFRGGLHLTLCAEALVLAGDGLNRCQAAVPCVPHRYLSRKCPKSLCNRAVRARSHVGRCAWQLNCISLCENDGSSQQCPCAPQTLREADLHMQPPHAGVVRCQIPELHAAAPLPPPPPACTASPAHPASLLTACMTHMRHVNVKSTTGTVRYQVQIGPWHTLLLPLGATQGLDGGRSSCWLQGCIIE